MDHPTIEYKGEIIKFYEWDETWNWKDTAATSLKKAKAAIDKAHKEVFRDTKALVKNYDGAFEVVSITSQAEDGEFWIKTAEGKRSKENRLYLNSQKNLDITEEIKKIKEQREQLNAIERVLLGKLEPFTMSGEGDSK